MINKKLNHYTAKWNDTGIIKVEPINEAYLRKLNIIND